MSEEKGLSRRRFLRQTGGAIVGLSFLPVLGGCDANFIETLGNGPQGKVQGQILPLVTAAKDFFTQFGGQNTLSGWKVPEIKADDWKLTVDGMGFQSTVTFAQLSQRIASEGISILKTIRCVFDTFDVPGLMSTGIFTGVPLRLFLPAKTELENKGVKRLRLYGADGFTNNITLDRLFDSSTNNLFEPLLVTQLNGEPLEQNRGFPVRLIIHEGYGYKNVKWIERVEFTDSDEAFGTYQDSGFIDDGVIRVVSKVTQPLKRSEVPAGPVKIVGMAISGMAGIDKVEVSIDDGPFQAATIVPLDTLVKDSLHAALLQQTEQFKDTQTHTFPYRSVWVRWEFPWEATAGDHVIKVRATDKDSNAQPENDPDSSDGSNRISQTQVTVK